MSKIYYLSFGCKVNQSEGNEIINNGKFCVVDDIKNADFILINCCSVTTQTLSKISKSVNKALSLENIKKIFLVGCISDELKNKYIKKNKIFIIKDVYNKFNIVNELNKFNVEKSEYYFSDKTRSFLKIQDGCNNFCSYCIVPYLRYKVISIPIHEVIKKIRERINLGFKEIVLCGISLGNYGVDLNEKNYLYKLLLTISKEIKDEIRIRLTSINPDTLTNDIINIVLNEKIFCKHFHLPLQSGSNKILKLMNRKYTKEYYLERIEYIRRINFFTGITTDIIVGFPDEREEDFLETIYVLKNANFIRTHIFSYSERKQTKAAKLSNKNKPEIIKERYKILSDLSKKNINYFLNKMINKEVSILIENTEPNEKFNGYSSEYIMCKIKNLSNKNFFYTGKIQSVSNDICLVK